MGVNRLLTICVIFGFLSCQDKDKIPAINFCEFEFINIHPGDYSDYRFLRLPTAFTPNSDGFNDNFYPITNSEIEQFELKVSSQGKTVFTTTDIKEQWDGKSNQKVPKYGTYDVTVSGKFKSGSIFSASSKVYLALGCVKLDPSCESLCVFSDQLNSTFLGPTAEPMFYCEGR
jgi:gliding motility-associated-like protein